MVDGSFDTSLANNPDVVSKRLMDGSYHLPGYTYRQDLYQYLINSHPLLGICFHHKDHPIGWLFRAGAFVGSIAFGLAITNIIYVAFVMENRNYNESYYQVQINNGTLTGSDIIDQHITQVSVTNGMIALWTIGSALNALYDLTILTIAGCECKGRTNNKLRSYSILFLVVMAVTISTLAVLIRATVSSNQQQAKIAQTFNLSYQPNAEAYRFLISYSVELVMSLFVWYPIVGCLLFSGILGCQKLPIIGGRQAQINKLQEERSRTTSKD